MRTVRIVVKGRVQGVFFRSHVRRFASSLNIVGSVKNLNDGAVEVVAQGGENEIRELIDYCSKGISSAEVNDVSVENVKEIDKRSFEIIY